MYNFFLFPSSSSLCVFHLELLLPPARGVPPPGQLDGPGGPHLGGQVEQARSQIRQEGGRHLQVRDGANHVAGADEHRHSAKLRCLEKQRNDTVY